MHKFTGLRAVAGHKEEIIKQVSSLFPQTRCPSLWGMRREGEEVMEKNWAGTPADVDPEGNVG